MPRRSPAKPKRWLKVLGWTLGIALVLGVGALVIGQWWLNRYLGSPEFRATLEEKTGRNLRAKVEISPIGFRGTEFFTDLFSGQGVSDAAYSKAKAEDVRGEVALPSIIGLILGDRKFRIPRLEIQKLAVEFFERDRLNLELPPKEPREQRSTIIENIYIRETRLAWGGGGLTGVSVHVTPVEGGWKIEGEGGRIVQLGLPAIELVSARVVRKEDVIFIQDARVRHGAGEISGTGEIVTNNKADLLLNIRNLGITPLLPEDWRARLHGQLGGELRVQIPLSPQRDGQLAVSGPLKLDRAVLEALPILNKLATYLRTEQFRRVEFQQASATVTYDVAGLRVENLVLDSKQLAGMRGRFTYSSGQIDGHFEVGITPGLLQWIPGSQEKVFTTQRDGYVWAPMRVTGPLNSLKEDLSGRLARAAGEAFVEAAENTATKAVDSAVDTARKGANGVFDLLFGN